MTARRPALTLPSWALLGLGGAATVLVGGLRWNVAALAWVAPVPFLLFLKRSQGWKARFALLAVLLLATHVQVAKIVTAPVPFAMVPMFAAPIAFVAWLVYVGWDLLRARSGEGWAIYAFPALMALAEIGGYRLTEGGTWGTAASTQLEDLPLIQLLSLTGSSGLAFLMGWVASWLAALLAASDRGWLKVHAAVLGLALLGVFTYGSIRIFASQERTVRVAGVVSEVGLGAGGLPSPEVLARNLDDLFGRSAAAAGQGARLVVWNEGASAVRKEDEPSVVARGQALAREKGIDLVLAYIVPLGESPFTFENKYVWITEKGEVLETYLKHHPVPGEGSVRGTEPLRVHQRPYGAAAGAICYDYDFPAMGLAHAALGAGLVVVPSSDWKGIDPYHTQMTRLRAIESGLSVVRPVRWATSMAFDAYGRTRGALPYFESNDRILLVQVPTEPVKTLYSRIGDRAGALYALLLGGAVTSAIANRRRRAPPASPI
jgi:apolipoprotein N-acyltransferase